MHHSSRGYWWGEALHVGRQGVCEKSVLSAQFCCDPQTTLKNKVCFFFKWIHLTTVTRFHPHNLAKLGLLFPILGREIDTVQTFEKREQMEGGRRKEMSERRGRNLTSRGLRNQDGLHELLLYWFSIAAKQISTNIVALNNTHVSHHNFSMSGVYQSAAGSSAQGLTRGQSKCHLGYISSEAQLAKNLLPSAPRLLSELVSLRPSNSEALAPSKREGERVSDLRKGPRPFFKDFCLIRSGPPRIIFFINSKSTDLGL